MKSLNHIEQQPSSLKGSGSQLKEILYTHPHKGTYLTISGDIFDGQSLEYSDATGICFE